MKTRQGSTGGNNNDLKLTLKTKQCNYERGIICATEGWVTHRCDGTRTLSLLTPGHSELDHDCCVSTACLSAATSVPGAAPLDTRLTRTQSSPHLTSTTSIVGTRTVCCVYSRRDAIQTSLSLLFVVTQIRLYSFSIVCQLDQDQGHTKKYTLRVDVSMLFCISRS